MRKLVYVGLILSFSFLLIAAGCQVTQQPPRPSLSQTDTLAYASTFTNLILQVDSSAVSWAKTKTVTGLSSTGLKGAALLRATETDTVLPNGWHHVTDEADNFLGHYVSNYYYNKITDASGNTTEFDLYGIVKITSTSSSSSISSSSTTTSTYTLMMGKNVSNPPKTPELMNRADMITFNATYYTDQNGSNPFPPNGSASANTLATTSLAGAFSLTIATAGGTTVDMSTSISNFYTPEFGPPTDMVFNFDLKVNGTDYVPIVVNLINGRASTKFFGVQLPFDLVTGWVLSANWAPSVRGAVSDVNGNWGNNGGTLRLYAVPTYVIGNPTPWNPPFSSQFASAINQFPVLGWKNVPAGAHSSNYVFWIDNSFNPGDYYIFARFFKNSTDHGPLPATGDQVAAGEYQDGNYPGTGATVSCSPTVLSLTSSSTLDSINFNTNLAYTASGGGTINISGTISQGMIPWPLPPLPPNAPNYLYVGAFDINFNNLAWAQPMGVPFTGPPNPPMLPYNISINSSQIPPPPNNNILLVAFLSPTPHMTPSTFTPGGSIAGSFPTNAFPPTPIGLPPNPPYIFSWSLNTQM